MTVFKFVLALVQAIPALKQWFDELVAQYVRSQLATMKAENKDAIREAIETQDQRPIERAIQSPKAGKPSHVDGAEIRDSLPGVGPLK